MTTNRNKKYVSGRNFEYSFLKGLAKKGHSVKSGRFFGSKGITDVWWVNENGVHNEAQLKYSKLKRPYIHPTELTILKAFAKKLRPYMKIWLVRKQAYKAIEMELLS